MLVVPIRAKGDLGDDYWLLERGILRVRVFSSRRLSAAILPADMAFATLGTVIFPSLMSYFYMGAIVWSLLVFVVFRKRANQTRKSISSKPVESVAGDERISTIYEWSLIADVRFRGRTMKFLVAGKEHNAVVDKTDLPKAKELIKFKLGKSIIQEKVWT